MANKKKQVSWRPTLNDKEVIYRYSYANGDYFEYVLLKDDTVEIRSLVHEKIRDPKDKRKYIDSARYEVRVQSDVNKHSFDATRIIDKKAEDAAKADRDNLSYAFEKRKAAYEIDIKENPSSYEIADPIEQIVDEHPYCSEFSAEAEKAENEEKGRLEYEHRMKVLTERLEKVMPKLRPEQQKLIQQLYFEGKKQVEIVKETGDSPQSVSNKKHRALKRLENLLKKFEENG